jgi:hypothetical protein
LPAPVKLFPPYRRHQARNNATKVFIGHNQNTRKKIAQIIGKVGILAGNQGGFGEIRVIAEMHFPQYKVTEYIQTVT